MGDFGDPLAALAPLRGATGISLIRYLHGRVACLLLNTVLAWFWRDVGASAVLFRPCSRRLFKFFAALLRSVQVCSLAADLCNHFAARNDQDVPHHVLKDGRKLKSWT